MVVNVPGENRKHKVMVYALSTCSWCKRTKQYLKDNHIEYDYVDVDLCNAEDRERVRRDIMRRGGRLSYPAIIIDDQVLITGFQPDQIREALEL
ncbi:MAG: glutaredoxin family protein [Candidatus Bathyarchaeota archaeon]|nr:MAG: glutaredoxin family protein [Candidatus Bathyarchaeota archaeon]